jgi:bifunctional UDP-N-acetylglucosamine pyrophosphorylase/glucosamine-1-phosphate N-acetyltransferase
VLRLRTNQAWMKAGVTMIDPMAAYVETGVKLAPDVTLWPGVVLTGRTSVGRGTIIGPHCRLDNAQVGRLVRLEQGVVVENARIEDSAALEAYRVVKHTGETE